MKKGTLERIARRLGAAWALSGWLLLAAAPGWAQAPLRLVVPVQAGGTLDAMARMLALHAAQELNEPVLVENRPGAGGLIGTEYVARSRPDGRTLLVSASFVPSNVVMFRSNLDPLVDLKPVIQLSGAEVYLVASAALEVRSVAELRALAPKRPGGLNCGGGGGQLTFGCERLRLLLGGDLVTIPYAGLSQAQNALVAGQVDVMLLTRGAMAALLDAAKVRVLAHAGGSKPAPPFDKLPALSDTWPDWDTSSHTGLMVAAETPAPAIASLNQAFNRVLQKPEVRQTMQQFGYQPLVGGEPGALGAALRREISHYARVAAQAGLKPQ
jgi:tripartite-type tricarboxylate transporter receptor subunit TctC